MDKSDCLCLENCQSCLLRVKGEYRNEPLGKGAGLWQ